MIDGVPYQYKFTVPSLRNGFKYYAAVTSYDLGNSEIESLESGTAQNEILAIPAPAAGEHAADAVTVFPNPYRVEVAWDQGSTARSLLVVRQSPLALRFEDLHARGPDCSRATFDGSTYRGENARGVFDPRTAGNLKPVLSGRTFAWDLITKEGQAAATGLYLYSVDDGSGKPSIGKFLLVKSDREGF